MRLSSTAFVLLLLASRSWCQQGEPQPPKRPTLQVPVTTEVVRVDVVVTDKGGRARRGLTRQDFVVLEDGQPQPITQFQAFAPSPAAGPGDASADPAKEDDEAAAVDTPPRYVVLAVDDIHIDIANVMRVRKALERFIESEVPDEDLVALVTTSGRHSQEFTRDRNAVRRVASQLTVQNLRSSQIDVPHIDEYQAERILLGDPEALRVAVAEIAARRFTPDAEEEARGVARQVMAEAVVNSRITLETLDNVVRAMAGLRGRKVVILLSDGFLTGLQLQGSAAFDMRRITDAGARSGVIVYGLDSRGLQGSTQSMTASSRIPMMPSTSGTREQMARMGEVAIHDAMNALSADTGGFLVASTNDLSGGLKKIMKDTETYYVLAYEPTSGKRDGAFRKIEVKLNGLRDIKIRHRKGYFAPDARRAERVMPPVVPAAAPAGPVVPPADDRVRSAIRDTLRTPAPVDGLRVTLSADFVSLDAGAWQVVVSGLVDLRGVPFARAGNGRVATFDVGGAVFNEDGAEVSGLAPERVALDFTDEAYGRALETGLEYQKAASVKPGRYRVSLAAREESSERIGSATQWVEVPDLAAGKFSLSSLFLMKEDGSAIQTAPSAAGDGPPLRGIQARPVYNQRENLHLYFFAYNQGGESAGFVTSMEIRRGGAPLAASRPEALKKAPAGESQVHTRKIALKAFEPGDYEVYIVVKDERQNVVASQRAAFAIEYPGSL